MKVTLNLRVYIIFIDFQNEKEGIKYCACLILMQILNFNSTRYVIDIILSFKCDNFVSVKIEL